MARKPSTIAPRARPRPGSAAIAQAVELRRKWLLFAVAIALTLVYPLLDRALGLQQLGRVLPIFIMAILALGLNIVVGFAGLLDLGYAAFFAIGAYTAAFLTSPQSPLPFRTDFWIAMLISFGVAALFGVILGAPTLRLRGDYLAIVTLAFGEIVPRVFLNAEKLTGGSKGMNPIGRPSIFGFEFGYDQLPWYYLIAAVGVVVIFFIHRLHDSRLGRAWKAMREDEVAAASMGIDLVQTKLLAFALGASFSGFAGSIFASLFQFIDPFQFDFSISIIVLAMVILGGMGNIWGVLAGALIIGIYDRVVAESVSGVIRGIGTAVGSPAIASIDLSSSKMMIFGLALVLLMNLRPEGIFPSAARRAELHAHDLDKIGEPEASLYDVELDDARLETRH